MHFNAVSIFPEMFAAITDYGVSARGLKQGLWSFKAWNPRDFTEDNYRRIDERPFGGGPGMVMLPGPLSLCLDAIQVDRHGSSDSNSNNSTVILLSPQGQPLSLGLARSLMALPSLTLLCGRYEAIDQRLVDERVDMEVCVGDFVVSGGELPAMLLMDTLIRRIPGVVNDSESILQDSFEDGLLDCPHYTRPEQFKGQKVPEVLLSGHHENIAKWRHQRRLEATFWRRPELLEKARKEGRLSPSDEAFLSAIHLAKKAI